jgi:hypothetical protein
MFSAAAMLFERPAGDGGERFNPPAEQAECKEDNSTVAAAPSADNSEDGERSDGDGGGHGTPAVESMVDTPPVTDAEVF